MGLLSTLAAALALSQAMAVDASKQASGLNLVVPGPKGIRVKYFPYSDLKATTALKIVSPHKKMNPRRETAVWSGTAVRELFAPLGFKPSADDEATIVGYDGYASQVMAQDFLKYGVIVIQKDGATIPWTRGGPQIAFPLNDPDLPEYLRTDSHWAWSDAALMMGKLPPVLTIKSKGGEKLIDLRKLDFYKTEVTRRSYPAGKRKNEPNKREVKVTYYNLEEFLERVHGSAPKSITLELYTGMKVSFHGELKTNSLIFLWDDRPVSHGFGGPVQLCDLGKQVMQCVFFIRTISIE